MPTPTPAVTIDPSSPAYLAKLDPWMILLIISLALVALMVSLWLVYNYINRVRVDAVRRQMLFTSVYDSRYRELYEQTGTAAKEVALVDLEEELEYRQRRRAQYLNLMNKYKEQVKNLEEELEGLAEKSSLHRELSMIRAEISELEGELVGNFSTDRIQNLRDKRDELRYQIEDIRKKAYSEAEVLVPPSLTVAGMGITGSFFIELTAILTIIFGIIILGLVGVLGTEEIAPILAAIAGYVLGKTTSRSETQPASPTAIPPVPLPPTIKPSGQPDRMVEEQEQPADSSEEPPSATE